MSRNWKISPKVKSSNKTILFCSSCGKDSGYTQEGIRYLTLSADLKCKNCKNVIVQANPYVWREC